MRRTTGTPSLRCWFPPREGIIVGLPPSITAAAELLVPRSIPMILSHFLHLSPTVFAYFHFGVSDYSRTEEITFLEDLAYLAFLAFRRAQAPRAGSGRTRPSPGISLSPYDLKSASRLAVNPGRCPFFSSSTLPGEHTARSRSSTNPRSSEMSLSLRLLGVLVPVPLHPLLVIVEVRLDALGRVEIIGQVRGLLLHVLPQRINLVPERLDLGLELPARHWTHLFWLGSFSRAFASASDHDRHLEMRLSLDL